MKKISPTIGYRALEGIKPNNLVGVQVGESISPHKPPRVYLASTDSNAGVASIVAMAHEAAGVHHAWQITCDPDTEIMEETISKAAECTEQFLQGFDPDNGGTLFIAGNSQISNQIDSEISVPSDINIENNTKETDFIPEPNF